MWAGDKVADLVQLNAEVVDTALSTVDKALTQTATLDVPIPRDHIADQILRETLLTVSSDWPFMVSKDSAADYARYRAHLHAHATREIAGASAWADAKSHSVLPTAGTGPTGCSVPWMHEGCRDENPDGVVGIPAGGDWWTRPARPSPVDGARRRGPRSRGVVAAADRHRPQHSPVVR